MKLEIKYPCKVGDFISLVFNSFNDEYYNKLGKVVYMDISMIVVDNNAFTWSEIVSIDVIDKEEHNLRDLSFPEFVKMINDKEE